MAPSAPDPNPSRPADAKAQARASSRALSDLLAPARASLATGVVLQVLASIATIAPYVAIAELGKAFLTTGEVDRERVWWIAAAVVVALFARTVLGGAALSVTHFADARMQGVIRTRIVERLGRVPLGWFTQNSSGLVRKATQNDISDIHYLVAHGAVETTAAITVPLAGLAYLFVLDWRLALVGVATLPIYLTAYAVMARGMTAKMIEMNAGIARISATIVEFVSGVSVVKTFGQAGRAHAAYRKAAMRFAEAYAAWVRPMLRTDALATIPISAPFVLLVNIVVGTWFVAQGRVSVVDLVTAALVAMTLPAAIMTVSFSMQSRREAAAAAKRITDLLATPVLCEPSQPQSPESAEVRIEGVGFGYDGRHRVLHDIDLTLPVGTVTALVGPSGSGKSTLATLVARFHDVGEGRISIGGVDVRHIATGELYRWVGFVLQDVQLLRATVADNIRLARPDATLEEVRRAARLAQIDDRVLALPRGYDSVVGVDALLSGGEAQRVSIARAVLADPPILILDEATAFADPESETRIQTALAGLVSGRTLLVIAHRLASITAADQIVVLDHGRIAEVGTHDGLLDADGVYARMWRAHQGDSTSAATSRGDSR
ncbi:ABC transporter ATP-binding protein [Solwaraspora sp. WMMB335]|uniref:ABC transporter ATP-binding protein n=1 Tax=Solwaraspora sp. WMMB335 TaxID=3404118 RepID=UPI003B924EA5